MWLSPSRVRPVELGRASVPAMSMEELDMGGFVPCNEAHAIVACSVTAQFSAQLPNLVWQPVRLAMASIGQEMNLGVAQPFYGLSLAFDASRVTIHMNAPTPVIGESVGVAFTTVDNTGRVVERYVAAHDALIFHTQTYVRWEPFRARIAAVIHGVLPAYKAAGAQLNSIKVEYWDRFDQAAQGIVPDSSKVVSFNSPYLARAALEPTGFWHSIMGKFERVDSRTRRLLNAKVEVGESAGPANKPRRSVNIYTMTQDVLNAPGYEPSDPTAFSLESVLSSASAQHDRLKVLLREILTPAARVRIGLEG